MFDESHRGGKYKIKTLFEECLNMKKITRRSFLAAAGLSVAALALTACGGSSSTASSAAASSVASSAAASSEAASAAADLTTVEAGKLTMATNATFPPYEMTTDNGTIEGIDVETAQAIADKLGLELQVTDIAFDSIIPGVQTGKYDIGLAGMTVTDERLEQVNFTDSYATGIQVVIVGPNSSITSVDDLFAEGASHVVGTQTGTTGFIYATSDIQDAGLGEVKSFAKTTDAVEALKNGQVDCVILDNQPAQALVAANADAGLSILDTEYAVEDYAAAVSKDNAALTDAINGALKDLIADGTVQTILDKYISE